LTFFNVKSKNTQNFADAAQIAAITNRHVRNIVISIQCGPLLLKSKRITEIFPLKNFRYPSEIVEKTRVLVQNICYFLYLLFQDFVPLCGAPLSLFTSSPQNYFLLKFNYLFLILSHFNPMLNVEMYIYLASIYKNKFLLIGSFMKVEQKSFPSPIW
jgi:hypothetical protein